MLKNNSAKLTSFFKPLNARSILQPEEKGNKKSLVAGVILTSLIDAFSILVIYLLVNFSNSGEILSLKGMELPLSHQSTPLKTTTLVKVEKDKVFVEDRPVLFKNITYSLIETRKKIKRSFPEQEDFSVIIQADKKLQFDVLNKIILASHHAGFGEVRFAVIAE